MLLTILVACSAPKSEVPTQTLITPTQTLFPPTVVVLPIGDGGLITGQPCESPCFFGIRIGETPLNQVVSSLKDNGISPCSLSSDTTIFCGENNTSIAIGADPITFIVDGIQYDPSVPITVEEISKKYGDPNFIHVSSGDIPEAPSISVLLLWDSIKMRIDLPETKEESYMVENSTQIQWIIFLDGTSYSNLTANGYIQPWKGYGTYKP